MKVDEDLILELNFEPAWARKPPQQAHYYVEEERRPRRMPRERREKGRGRGRPPGRGAPAPGRGREERRPRPGPGERRGPPRPDRRERPPQPEAAPVQVRFLPDQKRLHAVVRKIHATGRAYPLMDLAWLFLSKPATCYVRLEMDNAHPQEALVVCRHCGMAATDRETMAAHLLEEHVDAYCDSEETIQDAPTGHFVCVARCGLSGELLGPPNHHSYMERIREVHRRRFAHMSFAEYQQHIETLRDESLIEQWKEDARKQTVYRLRNGEAGADQSLPWSEVEAYMLREAAPA
ncbi:MAG: hypothetical protein JW951_09860, partial [Lentisphaerae bacterium]|nr:hypothetical protein [Lentisphaerota bacterium]